MFISLYVYITPPPIRGSEAPPTGALAKKGYSVFVGCMCSYTYHMYMFPKVLSTLQALSRTSCGDAPSGVRVGVCRDTAGGYCGLC